MGTTRSRASAGQHAKASKHRGGRTTPCGSSRRSAHRQTARPPWAVTWQVSMSPYHSCGNGQRLCRLPLISASSWSGHQLKWWRFEQPVRSFRGNRPQLPKLCVLTSGLRRLLKQFSLWFLWPRRSLLQSRFLRLGNGAPVAVRNGLWRSCGRGSASQRGGTSAWRHCFVRHLL